jgi:hypothetical protein
MQPSFSWEERMTVNFKDSCIYEHATARIHFTTYDLRRDQDVVNPRTDKSAIMVHSPDQVGNHPWCYARVLGIFHTTVSIGRKPETKLPFLWVRWLETHSPGGSAVKRLERIRYVQDSESSDDPPAFGFVDPADIVRGAHLLPAFAHGITRDYLNNQHSLACDTDRGDYRYYNVGQ